MKLLKLCAQLTVASKRKGVSVDNIVHFKCITCNKWNIEQEKLYAVKNIAYFQAGTIIYCSNEVSCKHSCNLIELYNL